MKSENGYCILDQRQLKKLLALASRHKAECKRIGVIPPKNLCLVIEGRIFYPEKSEPHETNLQPKTGRVAGGNATIPL